MCVLNVVLLSAVLACARFSIAENYTESTTEGNKAIVLNQVPLVVGKNFLVYNIREQEDNKINFFNFSRNLTIDPIWKSCNRCHTDLPRLRAGKVGAQFWVTSVDCKAQYKDAVQQTLEQIEIIRRLTAKYPDHLQLVDSADGIERAFIAEKIGSLIGVTGGHSIDSRLSLLRIYYSLGVRYMSLTDSCSTPWTDGEEESGLTTFGQLVVRELNRLGMIIDLTDASPEFMERVLCLSEAPVVLSSSVNNPIPEKILRKVKGKKAIVMVTLDYKQPEIDHSTTENYNASTPWTTTQMPSLKSGIDAVVAHLNYIQEEAGVESVGIGGGYDGDYTFPVELKDVSHFPDLFERLANNKDGEHKWTNEDLKKLAGLNLLKLFREVEKMRDTKKNDTVFEMQIPVKALSSKARECRTVLSEGSTNTTRWTE